MIDLILWYLIICLAGVISFPLLNRLLSFLPGKGYGFTKPIGVLAVSYILWINSSLHITQNSISGIFFAVVLYCGLNIYLYTQNKTEIREWIRSNRLFILASEILFLLAFAGWAYVRASSPELIGTEKPMELAFINAILRSPSFPPHDPWLAGYAISYYYFGYVMVSTITMIAGTSAGVAFNIAISLWFAMTALGAFDLVYELLESRRTGIIIVDRISQTATQLQNLGSALLAPLYILIISNLEGFLEILHAKGVFWAQNPDGTFQSGFWKWLNIAELNASPSLPLSWIPSRMGGIWWWRASRVLQDFDIAGQAKEIIDEFPFFSYNLADLHPHVLAMPFAIMAIAISLNLYLSIRKQPQSERLDRWKGSPLDWLQNLLRDNGIGIDFIFFAAFVIGGLAFINTWDFPIYISLFAGAYILATAQIQGWDRFRIYEFLVVAIITGLLGIILYTPFYLGFSSQAGGVLPSLSFFTRGAYFWVMFGTMLVPIFTWLISGPWMGNPKRDLLGGLKISAIILCAFWFISYILGILIINLPLLGNLIISSQGENGMFSNLGFTLSNLGNTFYGLHGSADGTDILITSFLNRIKSPGTFVTVLFALTLLIAKLRGIEKNRDVYNETGQIKSSAGIQDNFPILLILLGLALTAFPEFFYLRDQFGWRMNTIFKFYFQAWIIWGLASSYAVIILWRQKSTVLTVFFRAGWVLLLLMGFAYPAFNLVEKLSSAATNSLTLDGMNYFQQSEPDEWSAIQWLKEAPIGTVTEAVGGSYSSYARVSTNSGQPTVLGWPGHESQWRGGGNEIGNREADIQKLYRTTDWKEAVDIINMYKIRYIYIGNLERSSYRANESKFSGRLTPVFQKGDVVIYDATGIISIDEPTPSK